MRLKLNATIVCLVALFVKCHDAHAQKQGTALLDSLTNSLISAADDTNKVNLLNTLSWKYSTIDPKKGMTYAKKQMDLANKLNWRKGIALSFNAKGINSFRTDLSDATNYFNKALEINNEIHNYKGIAANLRNLGIIYSLQANYTLALDYCLRSLAYYQVIHDKEGIAGMLCNSGNVYLTLGEYDKAKERFSKSLLMYEQINDQRNIAMNLNNLGFVSLEGNKYDECIKFCSKALIIDEATGDIYGQVIDLKNIGIAYTKKKKYTTGMDRLFKALDIAEKMEFKDRVAQIRGSIGMAYLDLSKTDQMQITAGVHISNDNTANLMKAIEYLSASVRASMETGMYDGLDERIDAIAEAYVLSGNYKEALNHYKQYAQLRDKQYAARDKMQLREIESANAKYISIKE